MPPEAFTQRRTPVDISGGERLTRANCDGRTVTIEFIADRHSDNPMMLSRGCQRFAPGLALNNGGSVTATDHPDQFLVSMVGVVNDGMFSVRTRSGHRRSVYLSDLNGSIRRAWIEPDATQYVELRTGIYTCGAHPGSEHGVFLLSTSDGQPTVIRITAAGTRYEKHEGGFDRWPECRPVLVNTYVSIFGSSMTRLREYRVKVTPDQFPTVSRVS